MPRQAQFVLKTNVMGNKLKHKSYMLGKIEYYVSG